MNNSHMLPADNTTPQWNPPPTIESKLANGRIALIVVDVQNDFTQPSGVLGTEGRDTVECGGVVAPLNRFVAEVRQAGVSVIFTRMMGHPDTTSEAGDSVRAQHRDVGRVVCAAGSWGAELDSDLRVLPTDRVIDKTRASAFFGTPLDDILTELSCEVVLIAGLTSEVCVDATVRHAFMLDYHVVVLSDLVASTNQDNHRFALSILGRNFAHLRDSSEVLAVLAPMASHTRGGTT